MKRELLTITLAGILSTPAAIAQVIDQSRLATEPHKREILVTTVNGDRRGIYILDNNGDSVTGKVFKVPVSNFERWDYEGKIRYTYFLKDSNAFVNKNKPGVSGHFYVTDTALSPIRKFALLPHGDVDTTLRQMLDVHDFILLSDDHFISLTYYQRIPENIPTHLKPAPGVAVVSPILQEVKNGAVIWQWDATKYPELYEVSVEENKFDDTSAAWDYLHVNSLAVDPRDGNIIMSFRNASQVIKVHRKTGEIMWKLGGKQSDFALADSMVFLRQHHAKYVDGGRSVILFDNGDEKIRKTSRIVEFELDEVNRKVTSFRQFTIPDLFVPYGSSVQKIGDRYFMTTGNHALLVEYNYKTGEKTFEKKIESASYRAFKY
ncbi:aryl-sulfate sulfotransferase [Polluticoccus soli]|uniref:aryl-sulfate sulfotransferase n=1 Tax=Polluticoccus soli TaxID=3034150 RepID=UPI0023E312C3|nr:aryl-sulfate sulfotransferase [Flavipsychrobacter sp. JY13-12]